MMTFNFDGVVMTKQGERTVRQGPFTSAEEAIDAAQWCAFEYGNADLLVCEQDDEREAREGGKYEPRVVQVVRRGDYR